MLDFAKYRLPFFFLILFLVLGGTVGAIKYSQGYRLDLITKKIKPTGLLVATSNPTGAEVFVDGKLVSATASTIALSPGEHWVEIKKIGFLAWQKKLLLEKELVTETNAFLFPQVPDLRPLTFNGVVNPQISPDGTRIAYATSQIATAAAGLTNADGLWIMDLTDSLFGLGREPRQIAKTVAKKRDYTQADFFWSPDSRQILVAFKPAGEKLLLDAGQFNSDLTLADISPTLTKVLDTWTTEEQTRQNAKLRKFPPILQEILTNQAKDLDFSLDGSKVLYVATASAEIPEKLIPPVLAASTQKESRKLEPNKLYVYDAKEDKNFLIPFEIPLPTPTPKPKKLLASHFSPLTPNWFPTSRHLYWIADNQVVVCEYDATNQNTIYYGSFISPFVFASPGANKLIILTQLIDQESKPNLYAVSLR